MATKGLISVLALLAAVSAFALDSVRRDSTARIGVDSIVRVASDKGTAEYAKVTFELPVAADWKVLARTGAGLSSGGAWLPVGEGKTVPWYLLLHDGKKTYGLGVKVQPRAALPRRTAEAQDWFETSIPRRWLTEDGLRLYDWDGTP